MREVPENVWPTILISLGWEDGRMMGIRVELVEISE
jgi:hypothetical protein